MSKGGTPIPDPDPTGEYPDGWHEAVEAMVERSKSAIPTDDTLIHIAWLIDGLDVWHRSGGSVGHNLDDTKRFVLSTILNSGGLREDDDPRILSVI